MDNELFGQFILSVHTRATRDPSSGCGFYLTIKIELSECGCNYDISPTNEFVQSNTSEATSSFPS